MEILVNGLTRGAIYALVALGYTMVYGVLGMINFAHGEIFMVGMFAGVFALALLGSWGVAHLGLALVAALVAAMVWAGLYGYATERLAYRQLRAGHLLAPLTSAIGISIILQNFIRLTVSKDKVDFPRYFSEPLFLHKFSIGAFTGTELQALILGTSAAIMVGLYWLIHRTRLGTAMRAVAQDQRMAALVGIPVEGVIIFTFVLGAALAAVAGVMVAMYDGILRFDLGYNMGLCAFAAAVLGGIGNIPGAVLGGIILGVTEDLVGYHYADWKHSSIFVILMIVLLLRPRGLLGERVVDKV